MGVVVNGKGGGGGCGSKVMVGFGLRLCIEGTGVIIGLCGGCSSGGMVRAAVSGTGYRHAT